jgi:hypothetical protein
MPKSVRGRPRECLASTRVIEFSSPLSGLNKHLASAPMTASQIRANKFTNLHAIHRQLLALQSVIEAIQNVISLIQCSGFALHF